MSVPRVREIHNLSVIELPDGFEVSLHLKLPGELALGEAHEIAEQVERAIVAGVPEIAAVQTHLEPLAEPAAGAKRMTDPGESSVSSLEATGTCRGPSASSTPTKASFVFLTLGLDPAESLAEAHATASQRRAGDPERRARRRRRDRPHRAVRPRPG